MDLCKNTWYCIDLTFKIKYDILYKSSSSSQTRGKATVEIISKRLGSNVSLLGQETEDDEIVKA